MQPQRTIIQGFIPAFKCGCHSRSVRGPYQTHSSLQDLLVLQSFHKHLIFPFSLFLFLSFSHFPYHYAVSRMCDVWCSSCFLSPGLLIGVTAFTGTLVYCVNVEELRLDECLGKNPKPFLGLAACSASKPCTFIAIQNVFAFMSCINNYCIMFMLPIY